MSVVPALAPQLTKPLSMPETPMARSVRLERTPKFPSALKFPVAVVGASPAIRLGVSGVQSGVNGLLPLSFVVVTATDETAGSVPETIRLSTPSYWLLRQRQP